MKINNIKKIWKDGKPVINGWLAIPNSFSAEIMAYAGWDSLTIDLQHGLNDYQSIIPMIGFFTKFLGVIFSLKLPLNPAVFLSIPLILTCFCN